MYASKSMYDPTFERMIEATAILEVPLNKVVKVIGEVRKLKSSGEYVSVNFEMPVVGEEKGEGVTLRITPSSINNLGSGMPEPVRKAALALQTKFELVSLVGDLTKSREGDGLGKLYSLMSKTRRAETGADVGSGKRKI
ncbi:MAG: hypothetical protein KGH57_04240 [Candidatus Micrarchaeota archaeon]|nr:hypothetical protein [Candidatus Micrarchaeota archaeon]